MWVIRTVEGEGGLVSGESILRISIDLWRGTADARV